MDKGEGRVERNGGGGGEGEELGGICERTYTLLHTNR